LAAHFWGDFIFQSGADSSRKRRLRILLKHAIVIAASGYLLCGIWDLWQIPLILFLTHGLTDHIKAKLEKESAYTFILDQAVHLAVIFTIIIIIVGTKMIPVNQSSTF
jgi:hypothetical protein